MTHIPGLCGCQICVLEEKNRQLLDENKALREERDRWKRESETAWEEAYKFQREIIDVAAQLHSAQAEAERLRRELAEKDAQIERMSASSGRILAKFAEKTADFRSVLEMYANGKDDGGQRARNVLMKWGRGEHEPAGRAQED